MERLVDLGMAMAHLRSLSGLSIADCAARSETTRETLAAAERGDIAPAALGGVSKLFALGEEEFREGMVSPVEGVLGTTVFLLHGAYQDFDARDLGVLDRAMRAARSMSALAAAADVEGGASLRRRLELVPVPPAGPMPADAARQGHRLARAVRARLRLGGEPIEDMRVLLEEQFGIAVLVDEIVSDDLRAASILDAHRAAAAAVLASNDIDRAKNPALARVYLAHELGHLLFDPGAPGSVRVVLDDRPNGRPHHVVPGVNRVALLESRAKGFAAELLIPLEGVRALMGAQSRPLSALKAARDAVAKVREHFGTPWEIATYHLVNLNVIEKEALTLDLLQGKPAALQARYETTLPDAAATPLLLHELLAVQPTPRVSAAELSASSAPVAPDPPWYVEGAQRAKVAAMHSLSACAIEGAYASASRGRTIEAADLLVQHFDDLFLAGEIEAARQVLARLDARRLPPKVLTAVLMISTHARDQLGDARSGFFERVRVALEETWQLSQEAIDGIVRRLG